MSSRAIAMLVLGLGLSACEQAKQYTTTVEIIQVERFGQAPEAASQMNVELRYAECPADGRRVIRIGDDTARCSRAIKAGDKVKAEITTKYVADRGSYRSEIVKLGECAVKLDPKEEANYEVVQTCTDIVTTGAVVGVRCDRTRNADLVAKCPWLRRR